eukprot:760464-Hanusia_phi.AAC.2
MPRRRDTNRLLRANTCSEGSAAQGKREGGGKDLGGGGVLPDKRREGVEEGRQSCSPRVSPHVRQGQGQQKRRAGGKQSVENSHAPCRLAEPTAKLKSPPPLLPN